MDLNIELRYIAYLAIKEVFQQNNISSTELDDLVIPDEMLCYKKGGFRSYDLSRDGMDWSDQEYESIGFSIKLVSEKLFSQIMTPSFTKHSCHGDFFIYFLASVLINPKNKPSDKFIAGSQYIIKTHFNKYFGSRELLLEEGFCDYPIDLNKLRFMSALILAYLLFSQSRELTLSFLSEVADNFKILMSDDLLEYIDLIPSQKSQLVLS
jgi:hypothetical protein